MTDNGLNGGVKRSSTAMESISRATKTLRSMPPACESVQHFYRTPALSEFKAQLLLEQFPFIESLRTETCFNVAVNGSLSAQDLERLRYLLSETYQPDQFGDRSFLGGAEDANLSLVEVGPRMNFTTAWSSNAVSICKACGLHAITRIEPSRRFLITGNARLTQEQLTAFSRAVHDPMTECEYVQPLTTFVSGVKPAEVFEVPVMTEGRAALEAINKKLGLGFDSQDISFYLDLFKTKIKRNPTSVECFDMAQSNSEHSRHWFFGGTLVANDKPLPETLFQLVKKPFKQRPGNSVIAFCDNSSAQRGNVVKTLQPDVPGQVSKMVETEVDYDLTFTAETHNFPSGVAPFPGAETGTGGRIRDGHATGKGSLIVAGTAAYCVGNLQIPNYSLPWENPAFTYPHNLARPLQIIVDASNGASDYGNKFGEPVIQGYARSFGMRLPNQERREWIKPIMFSGGVGQMSHRHIKKDPPQTGMQVVKVGGPAYRIGMGGGAASSMVQGDNEAHLDFNAVQRGDAEVEQKVNRVIRTCVEMEAKNPIVQIHDQGAGGNGNVLKEIAEPAGAVIDIRKVLSGDPTLSVLELWGAEFQENDALLLKKGDVPLFTSICARENCPFSVVGEITGDGKIVVVDSVDGSRPVDLDLETVLGKLPPKTFQLVHVESPCCALDFSSVTVEAALDRVLRLMSVGSKRFLTNKVDRSVTGLVAQQQCVGPLHIPLADVAVTAQSHFHTTGCAISVGEQPIKGLINCAAMARLSVAEALMNMVWAKITRLEDIKASGNWMWAAKLPGEGLRMYEAAKAMSDIMCELGIALDGGKDSLSMAARAVNELSNQAETVKAPGTLVISAYCNCPDIRVKVTPDLKASGNKLVLLSLSNYARLGGSALAQVYSQIGDTVPDVEDSSMLKALFNLIQTFVAEQVIISGHDRSDGGLLTTVLEMAFSGAKGVDVKVPTSMMDAQVQSGVDASLACLFNEEIGCVVEVSPGLCASVLTQARALGLRAHCVGEVRADQKVSVSVGETVLFSDTVPRLRDVWEATSFELEKRQANPACVVQEQKSLAARVVPQHHLSFCPTKSPTFGGPRPRVAVIRQEGSNGDREMASAFHAAGFEVEWFRLAILSHELNNLSSKVWDVHMNDLVNNSVSGHGGVLDMLTKGAFRGVAFVGGFSYADVLDSAKGWAAVIKYHESISTAFQAFYDRSDTFSLGVCNGCQLMALLGWVPGTKLAPEHQPRFVHNSSGRYESRFVSVKIQKTEAIMFDGMEGSTMGVWVAHGEGRAHFPSKGVLDQVEASRQVPLRYVDDNGQATERYPFNPNGSPNGIGGLCSPDGRHLAVMPHPERCFQLWQLPYLPPAWTTPTGELLSTQLETSPWLRMFQNARKWCEKSTS